MMSNFEAATVALKAFAKTDAALPPKVQQELDYQDRVREFFTDQKSHTSMTTAILAAIRNGVDPAADPDVAAATQRATWTQSFTGLNMAAETTTTLAVVDGADAMFAAMQPTFATAVTELTAAHKVLGDVDLRDSQRVLGMGPKAATAWAKAVTAVETTDAITQAWRAIARVARVHESLYPAATTEWGADAWVATHHEGRHRAVGSTAWDAIVNGWHLRLADMSTLRAFEADIAAAEQREHDAAADRRNKHAIFNRR